MANLFTFNGAHASTKYIKAIRTTRQIMGQPKHTFVEIPFREGSYLIPDKTRNDITITVDCLLNIPVDGNIHAVGRILTMWLNLDNWADLIFDDDPTFTYSAIVTSSLTLEDLRTPEITIRFRCSPVQKPSVVIA